MDPFRDTIRQLKYYSQDFHPSITYLTGTKDQVAVAAKAYRVYFSKVVNKICIKYNTLVLPSSNSPPLASSLLFLPSLPPSLCQANENEKDDEDYLVDHSIVLYLVNPEGEFVDFFTQRMEVKHIVDKIQHYACTYKKAV